MAQICVNIDQNGTLLSITDTTTGLALEFETKIVPECEMDLHASEMKVEYQNDTVNKFSPAYFGAILADVNKITVCGNAPKPRFPSACAYEFGHNRFPQPGCGLPLNFDYCSVYYMVQTRLPNTRTAESVSNALAGAQAACRGDGYGHPGITADPEFLKALKEASCDAIEDDVLAHPFYHTWRADWNPMLREDGFVGVYCADHVTESEIADKVINYYVIVHNALAFFACDQLRVLIETNAKQWSWTQWKQSEEVARAAEFSIAGAEAVCARVVQALEAKTVGAPVVTTFNIINPDITRLADETVSYDAGVVRSSAWNKNGSLVSVVGTGNTHFVLLKNARFETGSWFTKENNTKLDVLTPANTDADTVNQLCTRFKMLKRTDLLHIDSMKKKP